MHVFLDTSVLVAASVARHPQHVQALAVLRRVAQGVDKGFIGVQSIAETSCATRSGAERIYTFNLGDFRGLAPAELQARICAP